MAPEISIIVPVYNVEKYIDRCMDSILRQTFADFELILVDDGSLDQSGTICDEYAEKDNRIRVIHQKNRGLSSARNVGLANAGGKYVMFCDSDDYVSDRWCETMYAQIEQQPNALVVSNIWRIERDNSCEPKRQSDLDIEQEKDYFQIYKMGLSAYVWNKIYNLKRIRDNKISFDETCFFAEDVGFNVQYGMYCDKYIYVAEPLYYYVQNAGSIMHRYYENWFSLHLPLFWCRLPLITQEHLEEYCDIWLYYFCGMFQNVFDSRNTMSFWKKLQYNQEMINSMEFKYCLEHASGKNENPFMLKLFHTHNYYLIWIFEKIVQIKRRFGGK